LPLLYNFALECNVRKIQENQDGMELNVTHKDLVYVDDVNKLGENMSTINKDTEALKLSIW
jgi:hypothetical protein